MREISGYEAKEGAWTDGEGYVFCGTLPRRPSVLITSDAPFHSFQERRDLYVSALEASLSGFDVVTVARRGGMLSVMRGCTDSCGRLHLVSVSTMREMKTRFRRQTETAVGSGGSVIAPEDGGETEAAEAAVSLCCAVITTGRGRIMTLALDRGREVALLRSSLSSQAGRDAAAEGCPVIDTFSSFLALPSVYAYPSEHGQYGFGPERFDIMRL